MKQGWTNRLWMVAIVAVIAILASGIAFLREPRFEGRSFSEWLAHYEVLVSTDPQLNAAAAVEAFQHMGDPAVQRLLEQMYGRDPQWKLRLIALAQKQSFLKVTFRPADVRRMWARSVLKDLGPTASNAVPTLIQGIAANDWGDAAGPVLACIGPAAVPHLVARLQGSDDEMRVRVIEILSWIGPQASSAIPSLLPCLSETNGPVRRAAIRALGAVALPSDEIGERLTQLYLEPVDAFDSAQALALLGGPGTLVLTKGLTNEQADLRIAAVRGLRLQQSRLKVTSSSRAFLEWKIHLTAGLSSAAIHSIYRPKDENQILAVILANNLDDPDPRVRELSVEMLAGFPTETGQILSALMRCSRDPEPAVCAAVKRTLEELPNPIPIRPDLATGWPETHPSQQRPRVGTPR